MKRIVTGVALAIVMASPAWAGFVENRAQWNALGQARQYDYVMGLIDSTLLMDSTSPYGQANTLGTIECIKRLDLNNASLAQIVNEGYARDPSLWSQMPISVLSGELLKICRTYIDDSRVSLGLDPLPKP